MIMLGTHKPQQQASLTRSTHIPEIFFRSRSLRFRTSTETKSQILGFSFLFACLRDRKGTPKGFCDKDIAELSGELSGAICLKILVLLGSASNRSENSLVLFVRFFGFGVLFWPLGLVTVSVRMVNDCK